MKTVIIQMYHDKLIGVTYGWYLPSHTTVMCQCIYAKLIGCTIYSDELNIQIIKTYPNDPKKQVEIRGLINRFDHLIATKCDIKSLRQLAKDLKMRVVVRKT